MGKTLEISFSLQLKRERRERTRWQKSLEKTTTNGFTYFISFPVFFISCVSAYLNFEAVSPIRQSVSLFKVGFLLFFGERRRGGSQRRANLASPTLLHVFPQTDTQKKFWRRWSLELSPLKSFFACVPNILTFPIFFSFLAPQKVFFSFGVFFIGPPSSLVAGSHERNGGGGRIILPGGKRGKKGREINSPEKSLGVSKFERSRCQGKKIRQQISGK